MNHKTFETLIDAAAELCGGQNALARHLGTTSGDLSKAKHGKKPLTRNQLAALADLVHEPAADVWTLCELANVERRNPFRVAAQAALLAISAAILSTSPEAANAASMRVSGLTDGSAGTHIMRGWIARLRARLKRVAATLRNPFGGFFTSASREHKTC